MKTKMSIYAIITQTTENVSKKESTFSTVQLVRPLISFNQGWRGGLREAKLPCKKFTLIWEG